MGGYSVVDAQVAFGFERTGAEPVYEQYRRRKGKWLALSDRAFTDYP
jgi:hypothetical protein